LKPILDNHYYLVRYLNNGDSQIVWSDPHIAWGIYLEKMVIIINHAADDPEQCIHPLMMAVNASSAGLHPVVLLQSNAVSLAKKGFASTIEEPEFPPVDALMTSYITSGGRILVSGPSLKKRNIITEELIDGVTVTSPGAMVREIQDAKHVLTY
jgi:predicted peroxiredoxin